MNQNIDIIVPTFNRPLDLKKFIVEIQKQTYPNFKVWIIDDHGEIKIKQLIPQNDQFVFIRQPENKGQTYARNIAIESSSGDIVISMDDDAWFENDINALQKIINYFDEYSDLGCLMFNVATPLTDYTTNKEKGCSIPLHITCGCAYQRNVIENIGGFSGYLHSGAEETDISLKIYSMNYKIRFAPDIKIFHNFNPNIRSKKWYRVNRYHCTRNDLLIVVMRYPLKLIPIYLVGKYLNQILYDLKNKNIITAIYISILGLLGFLVKLPIAIKFRKPLSVEKYNYWRRLFN